MSFRSVQRDPRERVYMSDELSAASASARRTRRRASGPGSDGTPTALLALMLLAAVTIAGFFWYLRGEGDRAAPDTATASAPVARPTATDVAPTAAWVDLAEGDGPTP